MGFKPDALLLVLLLFVSASIEVGALLLTAPRKALRRLSQGRDASILPDKAEDEGSSVGRRPPPSYAPPITPEAFLEAAKDGADLPFIHGRDKTAKKLGISSAEAKRLVGRLIGEGRIIVEFKRLRLSQAGLEILASSSAILDRCNAKVYTTSRNVFWRKEMGSFQQHINLLLTSKH